MEQADTSPSETVTDTPNIGIQSDTGSADSTSAPTEIQTQTDKPYVPFANGKEKFKVSGSEHEWDWPTAQKYAQLGYYGQKATEKAAETEKKARDSYQKLLHAAQTDPEGLIGILNPNWRRQAPAQSEPGHDPNGQQDPRDAMIQDLRDKVEGLSKRAEEEVIAQERKALEGEIQEVTKKYPVLNDYNGKFMRALKAEYKIALEKAVASGTEPLSFEDIAFYFVQDIEASRTQKSKNTESRIQQNREKAPESSVPGGSGISGKPMTREEVMRLAGRPVGG